MRFDRLIIVSATLLLMIFAALAQDPNAKHYEKDGLSFDYPTNWQLADKSTGQMQFLELTKGDLVIRVRSPRESLKTPDKEAHAKKLFQDQYVDNFVDQLQQQGMQPKRSPATTQIGGGEAEGMRVRGVMAGESGGLDSYERIITERLVNLSIIGSEKEITRDAPAWDMIRNSLKVGPAPLPSPKGKP
ncbi:MAG TPA: hypothetical protein VE863_15180 [Pyrinomonadaceae bacterium]|nr:hypothetical protein [Pyrinomonadaceae bacterium]